MSKSRGSVLLVSLVLLLIMTVAGLTAIRISSLEETISGNYLDQQMAFQAAEAALLEAEHRIASTPVNLSGFSPDCSGGWCFSGEDINDLNACSSDEIFWQDKEVWDSANRHQVVTIEIEGISARGKYIVEFLCYVAKDSHGPLPDPGNINEWAHYFRITALATGGTEHARVMLQTTFKKND